MAEIKLLPCPFCGGKAKLHMENAGCYVRCKKCGAYGKIVSASCYYSAADAAVESWNRRADNVTPANGMEVIGNIHDNPEMIGGKQ